MTITCPIILSGLLRNLVEYIQYADGTQICFNRWVANLAVTNQATGVYYSSVLFTFPVAFAGASSVVGGAHSVGTTTNVAMADIGLTTGTLFVTAAISVSARDYTVNCVAIGRWY